MFELCPRGPFIHPTAWVPVLVESTHTDHFHAINEQVNRWIRHAKQNNLSTQPVSDLLNSYKTGPARIAFWEVQDGQPVYKRSFLTSGKRLLQQMAAQRVLQNIGAQV